MDNPVVAFHFVLCGFKWILSDMVHKRIRKQSTILQDESKLCDVENNSLFESVNLSIKWGFSITCLPIMLEYLDKYDDKYQLLSLPSIVKHNQGDIDQLHILGGIVSPIKFQKSLFQ